MSLCKRCNKDKSNLIVLPKIDVYGIGFTDCGICEDCLREFNIG